MALFSILKIALILVLLLVIVHFIINCIKYPNKNRRIYEKIKNFFMSISITPKTLILLCLNQLPFAILYIASNTILSDAYWFEWTMRNNYLYLWIIVIFLILAKKNKIATFISLGNFIGIFLGQYLGDEIRTANIKQITESMTAEEVAMAHIHPAFGIWCCTIFVCVLTSVIIIITQKRKGSKSDTFA